MYTLLRANTFTAEQMFLRHFIAPSTAQQQFNQYTGLFIPDRFKTPAVMHITNTELYSSHVFLFPGFDKPTEQCHIFYRRAA
jgi:hypothetical protein